MNFRECAGVDRPVMPWKELLQSDLGPVIAVDICAMSACGASDSSAERECV